MKKFMLAGALATAMSAAAPASAALFVSGDTNIANDLSRPGNAAFFSNIVEGTTVLVQNSTRQFLNSQATGTVNFYNGNGFTASLFGAGATVTAADLVGVDLFIAFAPDDAFTAGETTVLANFLASGGNVLFTGENNDPAFVDLNMIVNDVLGGLGSGMSIVPGLFDGGGFFAANLQGPSPYLAGTNGLEYAAASAVTGGTGLFGTASSNTTFLAVEDGLRGAVPEPATWAMMIFGFGLVGSALRRRKAAVKVSYA